VEAAPSGEHLILASRNYPNWQAQCIGCGAGQALAARKAWGKQDDYPQWGSQIRMDVSSIIAFGAAQSGGPTRQGLGSRHDFVAVKLHPHTQPTVRSTDRLYMNYVPRTDPIPCGHVGDFLWHLKKELNPGAPA